MEATTTTRKTYLDILRILAAFLVCLNHSDAFHIFLDQEPDWSWESWFNVILPTAMAVSIPLFFMISGGLLLHKEETYTVLFRKRIWRFFVLLICISFIKYVISNPDTFSVIDFLRAFFAGNIDLSYWFLYAYLAMLCVLPFLRKIAKNLTLTDIFVLTAFRTLLIPVIMIINYWGRYLELGELYLSGNFSIPLCFAEFLYYPLVGYYLTNLLPMEKVGYWELAGLALLWIFGITVSAGMTYHEGIYFGFTQSFLGMFNHTSAIACFVIVRFWVEKVSIPTWCSSILARVGKLTLGIYLIESIIAHYFYQMYAGNVYWRPYPERWGWALVWCMACMTAGGFITWLLRKVPGVNKYL